MKLSLALVLAAAAGCGGAPFLTSSSSDAGADSAPAEAADVTDAGGGVASDGGTSEATTPAGDGPAEAGSGEAGGDAGDAGDACLPFTFAAEGCFSGPHSSSATPVFVGGAWDGGCGGSWTSTPPACVCDYTCACLELHAGELAACDPGGWQSCAMANAGHPVVSCL